jgi:NAD(P)-dependent dehydrogenase (short-subunit alcohol dehydrogenase family)
MRFAAKVVVVTGVGREGQVGEAVARAFAEEGATLVLLSRQGSEADERAAALRAAGHAASGHACELTDPAQVAAVVDAVRDRHGGRVHALVNLAGGFALSGPVASSDVESWQRQIAINLTTAYVATRGFLPLVRAARGAVVFVASEAALPGARVAEVSAYAAAKGGVLTLMRAVAQEERAAGVRANAIAPAAIRTATNVATMGAEARYVSREDVATAVLFLCSDAAHAVTGQVIALTAVG